MAIVNISQAALLTGKDRNTIQRHIKKGTLTKKGQGVDTEELASVFGELNFNNLKDNKSISGFKPTTQRDLLILHYVDTLQENIKELKNENEQLINLLNFKVDSIDEKISQILKALSIKSL